MSDNDQIGAGRGGLLVEQKANPDEVRFKEELGRSLDETEQQVAVVVKADADAVKSWHEARSVIENFRPVPWFIWRLSNYVLSKSGQINVVPEGMVLGLRRLLFAAASDDILGSGTPVNNVKVALSFLRSDVIAAVAVIHSICRRLANHDYERIWRPILEDALLRAQIGFFVGERERSFGSGRGMLAGFAGRAGLATLVATGNLDQARSALEKLAAGTDIGEVGLETYGCDPLQVSAMLLSACACGRDAAFGTASYAAREQGQVAQNKEQQLWLAAFTVCELVRLGRSVEITEEMWHLIGYTSAEEQMQLADMSTLLVRKGTGWSWII